MALTSKDIQDKADSLTSQLVTDLISFQTNWILAHKNYYQGIPTPAVIPQDGLDTVMDVDLKAVNDDEAVSWKDLGISLPNLPCTIAIINHNGPKGRGYTIVLYIKFESQIFVKTIGIGLEAIPNSSWIEFLTRFIKK